ncbi:MAG: PP2C family protein-serine/threonine phosphatase [Propioniciclava sp.]
MNAPITVTSAAATHIGRRRTLNEDAYLNAAPVFLVADGMGGHEAGECASAAVMEQFAELQGRSAVSLDDVRGTLDRARGAVEQITTGGGARAGTTLSGVVIASVAGLGYWLCLNIGDSRTYRFANNTLEQITVDHSVVQELIDCGELSADQAATDTRRNIITRSLGAESTEDADYWLFPAEPGDRILICSDGLSGELTADQIRTVLTQERDPQQVADILTYQAVEAGGRDNITVVVVDADSVASPAGAQAPTSAIDGDTHRREALSGGVR